MRTYALPSEENCITNTPRAVALGLFDGMHPGHRQVVLAAYHGIEDGVSRGVYTFTPSTMTTKAISGRLCTAEQQMQLLQSMGVDELFEVDFATVQQLTPEEFVKQVLHDRLHAVQVACGYNYRFGKEGAGDAALLTRLCATYGIRVIVVPTVQIESAPVSSTLIRKALAEGDMPAVRRLLSRSYCLQLPVVPGQHLGRRLGMPTINQLLPADLAPPRFGVYASCVEIAGQVLPAVTNIGIRPTVGADTPLAETWIQGFNGDLYGTAPAVYPLQFLRPECTFDSLDALRQQVQQDAAAAAATFAPPKDREIRAVLFDFDDTLGNRDAAFRSGLEQFIRYYYPDLAEEELPAVREEMFRFNRERYGTPIAYQDMVSLFLRKWGKTDVDPDIAYRRLCDGFSKGYPIHEDVIPTLTELRRRGYLLGILTNGTSYPQNSKLDHSGLRAYVDLAVVSGDEETEKPDPLIFRRVAARLGVPVESCLFVGDHPVTDIQGALDAGMQAVRKDAAHAPGHPFYTLPRPDTPVIRHIGELPALLAAGNFSAP